jgi:hypothetical protein
MPSGRVPDWQGVAVVRSLVRQRAIDPSPCPPLPVGAFAVGGVGVSRPIEGLDSLRADTSLRMTRTLASMRMLRVREVRRSAKRCSRAFPNSAAFGRHAGCRAPRRGETRSSFPTKEVAAAGLPGFGSQARPARRGWKPPVRQPRRRARPDGERAVLVETTEHAESRRSGADSDARQAGEPNPGQPAARDAARQERRPLSGWQKRRRQSRKPEAPHSRCEPVSALSRCNTCTAAGEACAESPTDRVRVHRVGSNFEPNRIERRQ